MDQIKAILKGFEKRLAHRKDHPTKKSAELFYQALMKYYQRIDQARAEGKPLAWVGTFVPLEIFEAMDIVHFNPELHVALAASQGSMEDYLGSSSGWGLPVEICSFHRIIAGMTLQDDLPRPDLMVNNSWVCDGGIKSFGSLSHHYGCPDWMLDMPHHRDEAGVSYHAKELNHLVDFLEKTTGRKLDPSRLQEVMERSQKAIDLFRRVSELRKAVPCPMKTRDAFRNFSLYKHMLGTPEAVDYFQAVFQETQADVDAGKGATADERFRIHWVYVTPNYALNLFDWMEAEYGAVVAMDMYNAIPSGDWGSPSGGIHTLARRSFFDLVSHPFAGPIENCVNDALRVAREYQIDGAIFFAHIGCKQAAGVIRTLKDALKEKADVPMLVLDGDIVDPSVLPAEELKSKMEGFFEMLEELPSKSRTP